MQRKGLYAGLGVIAFDGPQGHGFFKGGHDGASRPFEYNARAIHDRSQRS